MSRALRSAAGAALVAAGLFLPLVGARIDQAGSAIFLTWHPWPVLLMVAGVFTARLAWLRAPRWRPAPLPRPTGRIGARVLIGLALVFPLLPGVQRYQLDLGVLVLTYVMLGLGLNIVVGLAGLLDLGYVAFYAVGAYVFALVSGAFGLGFWACLPISFFAAAICGVLLGFPVLRLRGDYLAIVTLGFGEIVRIILLNFVSLTGGPNGISGIPRPTLFGLGFGAGNGAGSFAGFFGLPASSLYRFGFLYYIVLGLALFVAFVTHRLRRLPIGRAWEALREDEVAARALGINTTRTRLSAFALGAGFGGLAGAFFATRQGFISPESFTFMESAIILSIVVLGGLGSQIGVAVAALVMIGGFELARDFAEYRMVVFGAALVAIMVLRPRGLAGARAPSVTLGPRARIDPGLLAPGRG